MGLGSVVSWASADCPDNCYPDGLVGDAVVAQIAAKAAPPYKGEPFFLAAGQCISVAAVTRATF